MSLAEIYANCGWDFAKISGNMLPENVIIGLIKEACELFDGYFKMIRNHVLSGEYSEARDITNDILSTSNFLGLTSISAKVCDLKEAITDILDKEHVMASYESAYSQYELMCSFIKKL
ncbi:MAG: hypothetical protein MJ123_03640 [Lachnospiraceae bacterium]|nr:hypothetical protein [Lachnospiraceae bacterium]